MTDRKYIDFIPQKMVTTTKAPSKPLKSTVEPRPANKPVARPVSRPVARPVSRAVVKPVGRPVTKPVSKPANISTKPVVRQNVRTSAVIPKPAHKKTDEDLKFGVVEEHEKTSRKAIYSEKKNPFLSHVNVEKRPLSSHVPENYKVNSTKNVYSQRSIVNKKTEDKPVTIIEKKDKSGLKNTILAILVVLLGIGTGVAIYMLTK